MFFVFRKMLVKHKKWLLQRHEFWRIVNKGARKGSARSRLKRRIKKQKIQLKNLSDCSKR